MKLGKVRSVANKVLIRSKTVLGLENVIREIINYFCF